MGPQPGQVGVLAIVLAAYAYDALGNVTAMTTPGPNSTPNSLSPYVTTSYAYTQDGGYSQPDALYCLSALTDGGGHATHFRVLFTHRDYDPTTGGWLTRDPIGYAGRVNLYGYCQNDPVNRRCLMELSRLERLSAGCACDPARLQSAP